MSDITYITCNDCAAHIINGLDGADPDYTAVGDIESFIQDHGLLALAGDYDSEGDYWRCEVCGLDYLEDGKILELIQ